jgi:protein tyrosine phosphatase (PTP) superfamily phosphohydrolase (DUF442 family)
LVAVALTAGACRSDKSASAGASASGAPVKSESSAKEAHATVAVDAAALRTDKAADLPGLHNVVKYADGAFGGAQPDDAAAFDTLKALGVKTVISVDGAAPDVEAAAARGIRYIHLPIGYHGFDEKRRLELAKAVHEASKAGPVYMHCHHGKHRSAGALGSALVSLGRLTPEEAADRLKASSCAPGYKGLWAAARDAKPLSTQEVEALKVDLPAVSRPSGMVAGMVEIDQYHEYMKEIEKAGWKVPASNPDLVPERVAARLVDILAVLETAEATKAKPADFLQMMKANGARAAELRQLIKDGAAADKLTAKFKEVTKSCKDCHVPYRD